MPKVIITTTITIIITAARFQGKVHGNWGGHRKHQRWPPFLSHMHSTKNCALSVGVTQPGRYTPLEIASVR
jgi:hypothetical protein